MILKKIPDFFYGTPWRHMKGRARAGWINDHGVHRTHSFIEVIGSIREVFAYTEIFEKVRSDDRVTINPTGGGCRRKGVSL